jgi:hypothetical protein
MVHGCVNARARNENRGREQSGSVNALELFRTIVRSWSFKSHPPPFSGVLTLPKLSFVSYHDTWKGLL